MVHLSPAAAPVEAPLTSPLPTPLIALLGAPGTGADELAQALSQHLARGAATFTVCDSPPPGAALVLLMGLDVPCPAPLQPAQQQTADRDLRAALARTGTPFRVVYGQGSQRVDHALRAIQEVTKATPPHRGEGAEDAAGGEGAGSTVRPKPSARRDWYCEKCSDPECEHRLFSALIKGGV